MVKYISDSSGDMLDMEGIDFVSVPLTISTDTLNFVDDADLDVMHMVSALEQHNGRSFTACPSTGRWLEAFEGGDRIYVLTITSNLSGSYNSAMIAREMYLADHPDTKIHVFDTLSTGPEMRLLMEKLIEWEAEGLDFDDICAKGHAYLDKARLFFCLSSLKNLANNGRINKLIASAIGVLGISIVATASEEGTIAPINKCRGEKKVIKTLLDEFAKAGYSGGRIRISHVANAALAESLAAALKERFGTTDIDIYPSRGLCSFYAERGAILIGVEV